jgi:hypothetical protein
MQVELVGLNKRASLLLSFIISAIVHEYLICVSMVRNVFIVATCFEGRNNTLPTHAFLHRDSFCLY